MYYVKRRYIPYSEYYAQDNHIRYKIYYLIDTIYYIYSTQTRTSCTYVVFITHGKICCTLYSESQAHILCIIYYTLQPIPYIQPRACKLLWSITRVCYYELCKAFFVNCHAKAKVISKYIVFYAKVISYEHTFIIATCLYKYIFEVQLGHN